MSAASKREKEILVIDDSTAARKLLCSLLIREGHVAIPAASGEEGLRKVRESPPALILCDVIMPGMDGYEFCKKIKRSRKTRHIPVLLVTSRTDVADKVKGLTSGADDYVTKPYNPAELHARIGVHLRIRTLQDRLYKKNKVLARTQRELEGRMKDLRAAHDHLEDLERKRKAALQLAGHVQRGLLPDRAPAVPGYVFSAGFLPAEDIAGDFYDFIELPGGRWGIAIGDVAGKGVPASLLMVLTKTLLRIEAMEGASPSRVLANLNERIILHYGSAEAVTLFYGVLDPASGQFHYSNGGHEFPRLLDRMDGSVLSLSVGGTFLGIFPKAEFNEATLSLRAGDRLLLYTDGLYDISVKGHTLAEDDELDRLLAETAGLATAELGEALVPSYGTPKVVQERARDDVTVLAIDAENGAAEANGLVGAVRLHNRLPNLREVRDMSTTVGTRSGLRGQPLFDLVYSVDEAVANAIMHAYERPGDGWVDIGYRVDRSRGVLSVTVCDNGRGVEEHLLQRQIDLVESDPLVPRGRGLILMHSLMDHCRVESRPEGGTRVTLEMEVPS